MAYTAISAFVLDQIFGYQTANKLRLNIEAILAARLHKGMGGSRQVSLPRVASAQDAIDWRDIEITATNILTGFTVQARAEVRTLNAAVSITPRVQNVTDATTAGTGVSCTATNADYSGTNQKQTIAVTLTTGTKKYRLQGTPGATTDDTFLIGDLEVFA